MDEAECSLAADPSSALRSQVECVRAPSRNDTERLRQLVETHATFVWRYLRRIGQCSADCDEIVQEACLVVARRLEEIRSGCERSYLLHVAVNVASTRRRSFSRELNRIDQSAYSSPRDPSPDPEQVIEVRQARQELDAILSALTLDLRTVFVLYELEELTTREISEMLNVKEGTVASRLRRARAEFQRLVEQRSTPPTQISERSLPRQGGAP